MQNQMHVLHRHRRGRRTLDGGRIAARGLRGRGRGGRFVMFRQGRQGADGLRREVRARGEQVRADELATMMAVHGLTGGLDQITLVLDVVRGCPDVRLEIVEAEQFLDQLAEVHRDRTVFDQALVERVALRGAGLVRVRLLIDRIVTRVDQALDQFLFQHHFAENVLQVARQRSVLLQPFFGQLGEIRGDHGHVLLIGWTLHGEVSQQSDQLREEDRCRRVESQCVVLDEEIEKFLPDRRGRCSAREPQLHIAVFADRDEVVQCRMDEERVDVSRLNVCIQFFHGAKETRVDEDLIEKSDADRTRFQLLEEVHEGVDLIEVFHHESRSMVSDRWQQPWLSFAQTSQQCLVDVRVLLFFFALPEEMFENLFHRVRPDPLVVPFSEIVEQTVDLLRGQSQLRENRHLVVVEEILDQGVELVVRAGVADQNEDLVANQIVAQQTLGLQNGEKALQETLVDHGLILQAEMNRLQIVIERPVLIGQEHRDLLAVVDGLRGAARRFHRGMHQFDFFIVQGGDDRGGGTLTRTDLFAVDRRNQGRIRLTGLIDQHLLIVRTVAVDENLLQTNGVVIDGFVQMQAKLSDDVDLFADGEVDHLLTLGVQEISARNEVVPVGGDFAGDRGWTLTEIAVQMIDDGVVIDGCLSEGDQLNRFQNDRMRKLKGQRAALLVRGVGVRPRR